MGTIIFIGDKEVIGIYLGDTVLIRKPNSV